MSLSEAVRFISSHTGRSLTDCDALQANDEVQRKLWYGLLSSRNYENQISRVETFKEFKRLFKTKNRTFLN